MRRKSPSRLVAAFACVLALTLVALFARLWAEAVFCGAIAIGVGAELLRIRPGRWRRSLTSFAVLASFDVAIIIVDGINRVTISIAVATILLLLAWELWKLRRAEGNLR
jgi:hypothetical protein